MDVKKPLIGVVPLVDVQRVSYWMLPGYFTGIAAAGGLPVMLPLTEDETELNQLIDTVDGLLFTGGQDVEPAVYGAERSPACGECCPGRDRMEEKLFYLACGRDMPVFGICRGIQFFNAVLGGTIYQDLPTEHPSKTSHHQCPPYTDTVHEVRILPGTPLAALFGAESAAVNSIHHQAVKTPAPALEVMARSEDGLTEAVRLPDKRFVWAVQWHPEWLYLVDENNRRLFRAFIDACR